MARLVRLGGHSRGVAGPQDMFVGGRGLVTLEEPRPVWEEEETNLDLYGRLFTHIKQHRLSLHEVSSITMRSPRKLLLFPSLALGLHCGGHRKAVVGPEGGPAPELQDRRWRGWHVVLSSHQATTERSLSTAGRTTPQR